MDNNSIEDIMIEKDFSKKNKKGKKSIIVIVLVLLLTLAGVVYSYYINKNKETNKELFLKAFSNIDFNFFVQDETYKEIAKKISNNNFQMSNDLTMSTTMKQEGEEEPQDYSKYLLNWTMLNNSESGENYNEISVSYSDNKLINVKLINDKEKIAIFSDEIVNKYVGVYKENLDTILDLLGVEQEIINQYAEVQETFKNENLELDDETKQAKFEEYAVFLLNKLGEEKFTSQENQISLIKENKEEVTVNAYKLTLIQEEYAIILKELLIKLRDDEELIKKIVTNLSENEKKDTTEEINNLITIPILNTPQTEKIVEKSLEIEDVITSFILGKKIDATVETVQKIIDETIGNINDDGNGLEITVYVSEFGTEKISIVLSNTDTIDIEFNIESGTDKTGIITYLQEQKNGIKLEINKLQNDASTTIKAIYNIIEDKKINQKISIDVTTKGTPTSKNFDNECFITYSNNDGEFKGNIKNKINFDKVSEIEKLTDENCLFLDSLNEVEMVLTVAEIVNKTEEVYENKKQNLSFIDTNTQAPGITQNIDELRNLVVSTISGQMGDALINGTTYILENIQNLEIQGHVVNVTMENGEAIVNIDGVKFKIDSNFNLSDVE